MHFYITYDASAATMATLGDFEEISKIHLLALLHPSTSWWWWWRRPWRTMTQTPKTKSLTISLLKHLNGNPLGTTTTLVDHWLMCEVPIVEDQNRLLMASSRTSSTSSSSRSWSPTSRWSGTTSSSSIHSILFLRVISRPNASVRNKERSLKSSAPFNRPRARVVNFC